MSTTAVIAVVLVLLVAALLVGVLVINRRRTARLRDEFGPEYDVASDRHRKRRDAEKDLLARKQEHGQLALRSLTPDALERFTEAWSAVQTRFVDTPALALTEADTLVTSLLTERGYPVDDFDTKARLLSVEHAGVMDSYRSAHKTEIANQSAAASTEEIRNAFLDFRRVFEDVLADARRDPAGDSDVYPDEQPETRQTSERPRRR